MPAARRLAWQLAASGAVGCAVTTGLSIAQATRRHVLSEPAPSFPGASLRKADDNSRVGGVPHPPRPAPVEALLGVWVQDKAACESLCPFLAGLGMPGAKAICRLVDAVTVTLRMSLDGDGTLEIVDKTIFGRNSTRVLPGGEEQRVTTRGGRKQYMLSGTLSPEGVATIRCRLFQRGDGWETVMRRHVASDGRLVELNTLRRPGEADVHVTRYFTRVGDL